MDKFEEDLIHMTKPQVSELRHQDLLPSAITSAKDKSVLSWWWLSVPLYIIAAFLMKTLFVPHTTLSSSIHEFASKEQYFSLLFFLALPVLFIVMNVMSIRKVHFLSGSPKTMSFLPAVWFNLLIILVSILIILIYLL